MVSQQCWNLHHALGSSSETALPRPSCQTISSHPRGAIESGWSEQDISEGRRPSWWHLHVSPGDLALGKSSNGIQRDVCPTNEVTPFFKRKRTSKDWGLYMEMLCVRAQLAPTIGLQALPETKGLSKEMKPHLSYPTHHAHTCALHSGKLHSTFRALRSKQQQHSCTVPWALAVHVNIPAPFANTESALNEYKWHPVLLKHSNKLGMTHHFSGPVQLIICSRIPLKVTKSISVLSMLLNGKRVSHEEVGLPRPVRNWHKHWKQPLVLQ